MTGQRLARAVPDLGAQPVERLHRVAAPHPVGVLRRTGRACSDQRLEVVTVDVAQRLADRGLVQVGIAQIPVRPGSRGELRSLQTQLLAAVLLRQAHAHPEQLGEAVDVVLARGRDGEVDVVGPGDQPAVLAPHVVQAGAVLPGRRAHDR